MKPINTRIGILCQLELEIMAQLYFHHRILIRIPGRKLHKIEAQRHKAQIFYNHTCPYHDTIDLIDLVFNIDFLS